MICNLALLSHLHTFSTLTPCYCSPPQHNHLHFFVSLFLFTTLACIDTSPVLLPDDFILLARLKRPFQFHSLVTISVVC